MEWFAKENDIFLKCEPFDAALSLNCGQAFRWTTNDDGALCGFALGRSLKISISDDYTVFHNTTADDFKKIWIKYFDLERDYSAIIGSVSSHPVVKRAAEKARGIRILRQDPWETLCSFIISQNNNIPRIKGIIARLCETFGDKCGEDYSFPPPERLAGLSAEDLAPLRCGFRARYILDAARKVSSGEINLNALYDMPTDEARAELMKIVGVGEKVADCTLLFGLGHLNALPKDVWIKRVLNTYFDGALPAECNEYAGIVQQYLFEYARQNKEDFN